jgi:hypothetical protein
MNLFNLKETTERTGISRSSIYRFYETNPELRSETKLRNKKRLIPEAHLSLMTRTNIYTKAINLEKDVEQLKRLVNLLASNPNTIQYKLYSMKWDWFGTIAFRADKSKKNTFDLMHQLYNHIISLYGSRTAINLFFTVEPFTNRTGTHIHFVLRVGKDSWENEVIENLKDFFSEDRVELRKYDKYKAGIYYISKEGLKDEDWDLLGNDLA